VSILNRLVDERFLSHRRRSTSLAGILGGELAVVLFAYRYFVDHIWSWDLFAVVLTIVVVKLSLITWYLVTD
jgi:hypothetical protein